MNPESWYDVTTGPTLLQGDLVPGCPISRIEREWTFPLQLQQVVGNIVSADLIVMTQSCDLENDKIAQVLLAQVSDWPAVVKEGIAHGNAAVRSREFRKKLIVGAIPGLSLLHKFEGPPKFEWSVVNFHRLYTLPKVFLQQYAQSLGPRLRLRSPYREHLAQAFARYFMRVGLRHDAKAFEKEGDVSPP